MSNHNNTNTQTTLQGNIVNTNDKICQIDGKYATNTFTYSLSNNCYNTEVFPTLTSYDNNASYNNFSSPGQLMSNQDDSVRQSTSKIKKCQADIANKPINWLKHHQAILYCDQSPHFTKKNITFRNLAVYAWRTSLKKDNNIVKKFAYERRDRTSKKDDRKFFNELIKQ